ncbi:2-methylcitrate synthase/citrate synthase II [Halorubrum distributum JCM 9100]|uniref:Citrate synthase n=3 Tax=Halorubrum distributum TaxID=29283 RepID=M0ESS9_9EURY|nr:MULTISPECIES: citrate synthase [Halorubrum distributum group]PHQ47664.1 citrate synthase [Halorubrum sp. C3]ELZ50755.1 2-methylcitrate synthase/citrate synthase II [Halorubrum distributum JCM 9100]ELZ53184.1 2-methylcitrate synthase/citrate synthase II [Halorubrum distributum JCM 10118]MDV7348613.1 citrate synthase [Halorubrum distributum]MYL17142.1 citrate synthase [Halorubrum terrestre]
MADELKRGLEGVLVAESDLSYVDGEVGKLVYRGYDIEDLARGASYEEVLYLLWHGSLPTAAELDSFAADLAAEREVNDDVIETVRALADADERPMAALRTATSMLSAYDPDGESDDGESALRQGRRITAKIPTVLAAFERVRQGEEPVAPDPDLSHAGNFLYMLTGTEPDAVSEETFDMALTLHADHGLNASTFTAMVIGSTMADVYSGVTGGIGALSGPLHGGANQDVMEVLHEIDASSKDPVQWVKDVRADGGRIPGFGHRVYKVKDPRAKILEEKLRDLSESSGDTKWLDYTTAIEEYLTDQGLVEKGIAPNVDFYSGSVYDSLGIPVDMYTPIFAMSRVGGWIAHVAEYQEDNRLIRPRARYTGPEDAEFIPLDER